MTHRRVPEARLEMCDCGRHGHLQYSDDERSPEFCSKKMAQITAAMAFQETVIGSKILEDIIEQIEGARLPLDDGDADGQVLCWVRCWNRLALAPTWAARDLAVMRATVDADFHNYFRN